MEEYRDFVRDTGLTDVVFKGFVSDEDKIRYYQQCDVYCSPRGAREPGAWCSWRRRRGGR